MSFSENFKIKQLGSIEIKIAEIVKVSSKDGRCYKLRLNNVDSKEFGISDLFKNVQAISNSYDLVKKHAKLVALSDLIVRLKEADNKTDGSISVCGDFHSDYDDLAVEIQRKLLWVLLQIVNKDDLYDIDDVDVERAKLLLQHPNIDVNLQNNAGYTALMQAVSEGNVGIVKLLLAYDHIDVNIQNKNGDTALIIAVVNRSNSLVELLLKHENIDLNLQDNLNLQDKQGRTAMMYASASGDKETVELVSKAISKRDLNIQKEMLKLILLAHSIHKGGLGQVKTTEAGREYKDVNLEGINYTYLIKKMGQAIEHFSQYLLQSVNQTEASQLSNIFKCTINNSNEEILDRIEKGLPVLLPTGYSGHSVAVLVWGPYFILCNRGEGMRDNVVEIFKCDPQKIDNQVLNKIRNSKNQDSEAYRKLFFEELPVKLDFKPKADLELELEGICTKLLNKQSTGNCSWAAPEGSIFTFFLFNTLLADANGHLTLDSVSVKDLDVKEATIRDKFNESLVVMQMYELERYLGVDVLRKLIPEKANRNAERRQEIEIDYSVLRSSLKAIVSRAKILPNSDDITHNLKSILTKTIALTTACDKNQCQEKTQEILDSIETISSYEFKSKFVNQGLSLHWASYIEAEDLLQALHLMAFHKQGKS